MKKTILLIIILFQTSLQSQTFNGNLGSQSLNWTTEQKDFNALPRVNVTPMSIKLWDNYYSNNAPTQFGSLLEISGKEGHLVSQLYFNSTWETGRIQYRSAFYLQNTWDSWRYLLDSKSDVESSGNLKIQGNENSYILNGNLGIGTSNPTKKLDIYSDSNTTIKISNGDPSSIPTEIHLGGHGDFSKSAIISAPNAAGWHRQDLYFCLANGNNYSSVGLADAAMVIKSYNSGQFGFVGIGTISPDEKLTVKGKIHTQEVRVDMAGPLVPDYVFANDYKLKSLDEVEAYIKQNSHLPEIPSAKEIEKNGLMLAEMNMALLKKIEELTLYSIELNKSNKDLTQKVEKLEKENEAFKNLSERLFKLENQLK